MRIGKTLGGFAQGEVGALGLLEAESAVGIHFEDAGFGEADEVRLRPCGIGATGGRGGGDAYLPS